MGLPGSQHTSTPQLDEYLKGIRDEFDRLNHELVETRKERDEYRTKFERQAEELRELRRTISRPDEHIVPSRTESLAFDSPATILTNEPVHSTWNVEFNSDANTTLNLNLVHTLASEGRIYLAFSADGKYLATASQSGVVSIFDSKTGKRISVMKDLYQDQESLPLYECLGLSPDSKYLATGQSDGTVKIWMISQKRVRNVFRQIGWSPDINFSPNGHWIATTSPRGYRVRIWRLRDGFSRDLSTLPFNPWAVRFSPDGRFIVSGSDYHDEEGHVLIWEVRTGNLVANWKGHSNIVAGLLFTPDGKGLLSVSMDQTAVHWDAASLGKARPPSSGLKEISRLEGHTFYIYDVSISPDGKWIATGSWDKTVRIWNAHDATCHCILHCPGEVWSVDFSPVGNYLAIGGQSNEITIWNYEN